MKATKTKRLLAACLALMLTIGLLATGVFAAETTTVSDEAVKTGENGQIVVTVYDQTPGAAGTGAQVSSGLGNPVDGVGINALRIGSVVELTTSTTDDAAPSTPTVTTQVAFGLNHEMATLLGLDTTDDPIAVSKGTYYYAPTVAQGALSTQNDAEGGQDAIEAYLNTVENGATKQVTDSDGVATFSDLDYGLYLLAKSELPSTATTDLVPFLVSVPMYINNAWSNTVHAYPKVRTEKIQPAKTAGAPADDAYVSAGDTIPFTITMTIPAEKAGAGDTMAFESFVITDTNADKTLVVDTDSIVVELDSNPLDKPAYDQENPPALTSGDYEVKYENGTLTITLTAAGLNEINNGMTAERDLTITYNATVATDVTFSSKITNSAVLTYDRGSGVVTSDTTTVNLYTYGLDLTKTLSDAADDIGANIISFALYTDEECTEANKIPVVSGNGGYWVAAQEAGNPVVMYISSGENSGNLNLYGLEPGTYYLKELATQSGYTLLDSPITIVITANETPDGDPTMTATVNKATAQVENGVVYLQVENTKNDGGFNLPQTGGAGTLLATAIGLGLLCAGVVLLVAYRKKSHS